MSDGASRADSPGTPLVDAAVLLLVLTAALLALPPIASLWLSPGHPAYGVVIGPLGLWLLWWKASRLERLPAAREPMGLVVLALALAVYTVGMLSSTLFIQGLALVCAGAGAVWYLRGSGWLRKLSFPLGFLLFAVPLPPAAMGALTNTLRLGVAETALLVVRALGLPVVRQANTLELPTGTLSVANACSGIDSIVVLAPAAVLLGYFTRSDLSGRLLLAFAALPIALISSFVGFLAVVVGALEFGVGWVEGPTRDAAGLLTFALGCLGLVAVDKLSPGLDARALERDAADGAASNAAHASSQERATVEQFFGMRDAPFSLAADPSRLWLSETHAEGLACLFYGITHRKGLILLTGGAGVGKTILLQTVLRRLPDVHAVLLSHTHGIAPGDLRHHVAKGLGIANPPAQQLDCVAAIERVLRERAAAGGDCVLVIDECQDLCDESLEEVRLLSNLDGERDKLLQIVLTGQPELIDRLKAPSLLALRQRIALRHHVEPLSAEDAHPYLAHRILVAGGNIDDVFEAGAESVLYRHTRGYPRLLNVLADRILLAAFAASLRPIPVEFVADTAALHDFDSLDASPSDVGVGDPLDP